MIEVSDDQSRLDVPQIHGYICNRSYWGRGRTLQQVQDSIRNSICFGAYADSQFVGFTRVVTDKVAFAYVLDLFVLEDFRKRGVSRKLVEAMLDHSDLQTVNWLLGTNDAHGLYEKYGFEVVEDPRRFMRKPRS
jgi:GNAT superfamily N-acetyltransferase